MSKSAGRGRAAKQKVPTALAERAAAAKATKLARVREAAKADVELVKRRIAEVEEAFYDIGEALRRLKQPDMYKALGSATWQAFCETHVKLSVSQADRFILIVERMSRKDAIALGSVSKAAAVAELVAATPEEDTVGQAIRGGVRVRGKKVDVAKTSAREISRLKKKVARRSSRSGRTITAADEAYGEKLEAALRRAGSEDARVRVKAGPPGRPTRIEIELDLPDLSLLRQAFGKLPPP